MAYPGRLVPVHCIGGSMLAVICPPPKVDPAVRADKFLRLGQHNR